MQVSNSTTVVARNLSKTYSLTSSGSEMSLFARQNKITVNALRNVSFTSNSGESIGVVGRNGSGKSTLFRIIAGSEAPTAGEVLVSSNPTLLGVSSALQNNLSGTENIMLGLLAMGISPSQARDLCPKVAEWADIGEAVKRPLKTYSSGMRARLVFSISTSVRREILLVDEALSTGDSAFTSRARERMNQYLDSAGTVFIVSHGAGTIQEYCTRALWLHDGEILMDADAEETTKAYVRWSKMKSRGQVERADSYLESVKNNYAKPSILLDSEAASSLDRMHRVEQP